MRPGPMRPVYEAWSYEWPGLEVIWPYLTLFEANMALFDPI